jgi:hypothetical protein
MNEHIEPNLIQLLLGEGPMGLFVLLFSIACTAWLLVSRIRACFRAHRVSTARDLALLFSGPVTAVLYSAIKAIVAAQCYVRGGIDAEHPLIYGLGGAIAICLIALIGFVLGVFAFALPPKTNATVA